jgi:hypothetical protein
MNYFVNSSSGLALAALLLLSSPAMAESQKDQARRAIAEASGKIDASIKVGTGGGALGLQNQARTSLRSARLDLASGLKAQAIIDANHASMLADAAIAETQRSHAAAENAQRSNTEALASTALQSAAVANARADAAQQAATIANAEAANARANPMPVVIMAPAPAVAPTTTVTTETSKSTSVVPARTVKRRTMHHVVHHNHRSAPHAVTQKTTTTVTTKGN